MRTAHLGVLAGLAAAVLAGAARAAPEPPKLGFPLACQIGRTCEIQHYVDRDPGPGVRDYRCGRRTYQGHSGVDIRILDMAAEHAGVAVLAAAPGRVTRLRDGVQDISIRAPGAPPLNGQDCGNGVVIDHGGGWETQYCHMARGSLIVKAGDLVAAGQPIGKVGLSGNTEFAHMHLTVRHAGQVIDPFAPDMSQPMACAAQTPLWTAQARQQMAYKAGAILNVGFAGGPVTQDAVEAGGIPPVNANSPWIVPYARAIELEAGDVIEIALTGPGGLTLSAKTPPLDHDKAQFTDFIGKRRPPAGWPAGVYTAVVRVHRAGAVAIERRFETRL